MEHQWLTAICSSSFVSGANWAAVGQAGQGCGGGDGDGGWVAGASANRLQNSSPSLATLGRRMPSLSSFQQWFDFQRNSRSSSGRHALTWWLSSKSRSPGTQCWNLGKSTSWALACISHRSPDASHTGSDEGSAHWLHPSAPRPEPSTSSRSAFSSLGGIVAGLCAKDLGGPHVL